MRYHSLAERPDLVEAFWSMENDWPVFMGQDPVAATRYNRAVAMFPELHLVAMDGADVVARVHAVPISWPGAEQLPDRGWDWALESGVDQPETSRRAVSLIEARIAPQYRGQRLSQPILAATREAFAAIGVRDLVAPVRPNGKAVEPRTPPAEYAWRKRDDGLPADAWLRVHVRLGAELVRVAPLAMTIPGTLSQWRQWTDLPFDKDGLVEVPGALAPVLVDTVQGHAVYVEPNVWVHHQL